MLFWDDPRSMAMRFLESVVEESELTISGWSTDTVCIRGTFVNDPAIVPTAKGSTRQAEEIILEHHDYVKSSSDSNSEERTSDDAFSILQGRQNLVLLFLPGNPGCIAWYIPMLKDILEKIMMMKEHEGGERGNFTMEVWGCSYAGHGVGEHKTNPIDSAMENIRTRKSGSKEGSSCLLETIADAHTLEGQIRHKLEWIDWMVNKKVGSTNHHRNGAHHDNMKFIWLSHSIGSYLVQEILLRRPLLLKEQTLGVIHLMPFIRFDPSLFLRQSLPLSVVAQTTYTPKSPFNRLLQTASVAISKLPPNKLDEILLKNGIQCPKMRQFTSELITQPKMAENFLTLGCHEIRVLKAKTFDELMLNIIGQFCSLHILYGGVGPDQWAPKTHHDQLLNLQRRGKVPQSIRCSYKEELKHDFIVNTEYMTPIVTQYCVDTIQYILVQSFVSKQNINVKDRKSQQIPKALPPLKSNL